MDDFMYYIVGVDGTGSNPGYSGMTKKYIHFVNDYHNKTQVIGIKVNKKIEHIKMFIDSVFDLDICKNMYYVDNDGEHIKLSVLENIVNKTCNLVIKDEKFINHCPLIINRCEKYQNRGFRILNLESKKHAIHSKLLTTSNYVDYSHILGSVGKNLSKTHIFRAIYQDDFVIIHPDDKDSYLQVKINVDYHAIKGHNPHDGTICHRTSCYHFGKCFLYGNCWVDYIHYGLKHIHKGGPAGGAIFIIV
jgi:hypothetical protein